MNPRLIKTFKIIFGTIFIFYGCYAFAGYLFVYKSFAGLLLGGLFLGIGCAFFISHQGLRLSAILVSVICGISYQLNKVRQASEMTKFSEQGAASIKQQQKLTEDAYEMDRNLAEQKTRYERLYSGPVDVYKLSLADQLDLLANTTGVNIDLIHAIKSRGPDVVPDLLPLLNNENISTGSNVCQVLTEMILEQALNPELLGKVNTAFEEATRDKKRADIFCFENILHLIKKQTNSSR